jgi:hypothetical protein
MEEEEEEEEEDDDDDDICIYIYTYTYTYCTSYPKEIQKATSKLKKSTTLNVYVLHTVNARKV